MNLFGWLRSEIGWLLYQAVLHASHAKREEYRTEFGPELPGRVSVHEQEAEKERGNCSACLAIWQKLP